jgi:hypothetical protein
MTTHEKVINALRDGQQTAEEVSVNALLDYRKAKGSLVTLVDKGVVGVEFDQDTRFYYLTGVDL